MLKRSVEMLALQCAQRFSVRPADLDFSLFTELFPKSQPEPSQPDMPTAKAKQMHLMEPVWFSVQTFQAKVCNSLTTGSFVRLFPAGVSDCHPQDA